MRNRSMSLLLAATLALLCCGCDTHREYPQIAEQTEYGNDYTRCLYMEYDELKKYGREISNFERSYIDISKPSENITVELGYVNIANHADSLAVEINENGLSRMDEEVSCTFDEHYPVQALCDMADVTSVDELWKKYGQPYKYTELSGIRAMLFKDTLLFDGAGGSKAVTLDERTRADAVSSMQINGDMIYLFERALRNAQDHIAVTAIPVNGGDVSYTLIPFSDMGLERNYGQIAGNNIFINNGVLFFVIEKYGSDYIGAYDLESGRGTNIELPSVISGKLFCYNGTIGLMTCSKNKDNDSGYYTDMEVRFFGFDKESFTLTENADMRISLPQDAKYIFNAEGNRFFCVDGRLCGVMYNYIDHSSAYIELDLSGGAVTSFIPFVSKMKYHSRIGYTVKLSGTAVSQHNCDL